MKTGEVFPFSWQLDRLQFGRLLYLGAPHIETAHEKQISVPRGSWELLLEHHDCRRSSVTLRVWHVTLLHSNGKIFYASKIIFWQSPSYAFVSAYLHVRSRMLQVFGLGCCLFFVQGLASCDCCCTEKNKY